jgi:hypothetical protein
MSEPAVAGRSAAETPLAKAAGNVLEFGLETFDMNRAYAFWFHFYGFPLPLAEGSI